MSKFLQKQKKRRDLTYRLVVSSMLIATATLLSIISSLLNMRMPMGGSITLASLLPIIVIAYMYGLKWGMLSSITFAVIEIMLSFPRVSAFFLPTSSYTAFGSVIVAAIAIVALDYFFAYSVIGFAALTRKKQSKTSALCWGAVIALSLRLAMHFLSGLIFFGQYYSWGFGQIGGTGEWFMSSFGTTILWVSYSFLYNALYIVPELVIILVAIAGIAHIKEIRKYDF